MEFASRITLTCFIASYGLGMLFEVLRIFWPQRGIRWAATAATTAGTLAQGLYLLSIVVSERRLPIVSQFESLIFVSWLITLVYLYLLVRDRRLGAGLFILPVSLGLLLYAATVPVRDAKMQANSSVVGIAHGILLLLGTVFVLVALVVALMYLVKVYQLKHGNTRTGVRLPSLERLERMNTASIYLAWPMLTLGILLGFALQQIQSTDLKVLTTCLAWLVFTILVHYRYQPENRGRRVAVLTVVACAVVLFSVLGDPIFGTTHQVTVGGPR